MPETRNASPRYKAVQKGFSNLSCEISHMEHTVRDLSLAPGGERKIEWAQARMPVLRALREQHVQMEPLKGVKVGVCLHLEAKTAVLCSTMQELGAEVSVTSSNPLTTQDDVAAALASRVSHVFSWRGETQEEYALNLGRVLDQAPDVLVDDGADLSVMATQRNVSQRVIGATEETTTGLKRFRSMKREGVLRFPVIAVNDARSKRLFDNRFGSGQSVVDGLMRATNVIIAGKRCVVVGYGWVGMGVAERLRGMGARVIVTEVDPFRALEAHFDGYEVMKMDEAAPIGDIFITCTGVKDVVGRRHFSVMKDGAMLANAGHFDVEVNVRELEEMSVSQEQARPNVTKFTLKDGRDLFVLAEGRLVNIAAADGHPIEIMDMSFSLQLLSVLYLVRNRGNLQDDVLPVPPEVDRRVAELKLEAEGIGVDSLTPAQKEYLESWRA
jgi:adenosylhomocysteinase